MIRWTTWYEPLNSPILQPRFVKIAFYLSKKKKFIAIQRHRRQKFFFFLNRLQIKLLLLTQRNIMLSIQYHRISFHSTDSKHWSWNKVPAVVGILWRINISLFSSLFTHETPKMLSWNWDLKMTPSINMICFFFFFVYLFFPFGNGPFFNQQQ